MKTLVAGRLETSALNFSKEEIKNIQDNKYLAKKPLELRIQTTNFDESQIFSRPLDVENSRSQVRKIALEVSKESKVQSIDRKSINKVKVVETRISSQSRNQFKQALNKIKSFGKSHLGPTPRAAISKARTNLKIESLSVQDKKAISDYLTQFASLDRDKNQFLNELDNSSGINSKGKQKESRCLSCILKDLKTIGWGNNELNIFERTPSYSPHPSLPYIYYQNNMALEPSDAQSTWGRWDSVTHPYRNFFVSESEWLQTVQEINNYWKAYYRTYE